MNNIDWNRLQPLRVCAGSHQKGSGRGCAMNVISYITGEAEITDFPACSDPDLSRHVQALNDRLADLDTGYLSPEHAVAVVEIGMMTVGTAGYGYTIRRQWHHDSALGIAWKRAHFTGEALALTCLSASTALSMRDAHGRMHRCERNPYDTVVAQARQEHQEAAKQAIEALRTYIAEWRKTAGLDEATPADTAVLEKALIR